MKNLKSYITHLTSRKLIKTSTLNKINPTSSLPKDPKIYCGFDPTATRIHFGNYCHIITLARSSIYDLTPIVLIGEATASIGDPSGKNKEREIMSDLKLRENRESMENQLKRLMENTKKYLKRKKKVDMKYLFLNNKDFYRDMDILEFFRNFGFKFNLSSLISKETVKRRLDTNQSISYTEFSYQIFQAIDFFFLRTKHNCILQIGGSDQWGNIITGIELCHKMGLKNVDGLTTELLLDENGNKFGKSEGNPIWIDSDDESLLNIYQYIYNVSDLILEELFLKYTFLEENEIFQVLSQHRENLELRFGQMKLALEILEQVSGCKRKAMEIVNYKKYFLIDFETFKGFDLEYVNSFFCDMMNVVCVRKEDVEGKNVFNIIKEFLEINITNGEFKKIFKSKGVRVNGEIVCDFKEELKGGIKDIYYVIKIGKKNYHTLKIN